MENPESQATQYQRKKIKQISRIVLPVTLDSPLLIFDYLLSLVLCCL
jgi:hypothetical protein